MDHRPLCSPGGAGVAAAAATPRGGSPGEESRGDRHHRDVGVCPGDGSDQGIPGIKQMASSGRWDRWIGRLFVGYKED